MNKYLSDKIKNLSFFSILLVVLLHSYNLQIIYGVDSIVQHKSFNVFVQNLFSQQICRIAVPLFFVLSGYLFFINMNKFDLKEFSAKYKSRFYSLFIPYLIWCISGLIFFYILQVIPQTKGYFNSLIISNMSFPELFHKTFIDPFPYQLWFIKDLMLVIFLFSPLIYISSKYIGFFTLFITGSIWFFNLSFLELNPMTIFFFSCGAILAIKRINLDSMWLVKKGIGLFSLWIIMVLILTTLGILEYDNLRVYKIINKLTIVLGVYSVWSFYDILKFNSIKFKDIYYKYASFSFFLFLFHEPILTCFKRFSLSVLEKSDTNSFIVYWVTPIVVVVISLKIGFYLKKYIPGFYSFLTGGR